MDEQAVLAADDARRRAMVETDMATLDRLLADGLVHVHANGKAEGKADWMAGVASRAGRYRRVDRTEAKVTVNGDTAWLVGRQLVDIAAPDGTVKPMDNRVLSVWTRTGGGWRMNAYMAVGIKAPAPGG